MISLESISKGKRLRAGRFIIAGKPKIGKSTLACSAPNPIVISIAGEEGIDALDVASFPTCKTYKEVIECIRALYVEDHDYKTLVIDSMSALEPLVWQETCERNNVKTIEKVGGGFGKGYVEALSVWSEITKGLDALRNKKDMAIILIAHVKVKVFNEPGMEGYDQYQLNVHKDASSLLTMWADSVLFCNYKKKINKEDAGFNKERAVVKDLFAGERFLYTQERATHPGGGRWPYGNLPYEIKLDWNAFMAEVMKVVNNSNTVEQGDSNE